jgi:hypothetical protein
MLKHRPTPVSPVPGQADRDDGNGASAGTHHAAGQTDGGGLDQYWAAI